jgi:hypothetical protein
MEFTSWISIEFKLYVIKEFQRLKEENSRLKLELNLQCTLAKVNYHIHTDAIKENLIPKEVTKKQMQLIYAEEADRLVELNRTTITQMKTLIAHQVKLIH